MKYDLKEVRNKIKILVNSFFKIFLKKARFHVEDVGDILSLPFANIVCLLIINI